MKDKKLILIVCLFFLITAPVGQIIFGYAGGYLSYLFSEVMNAKAHEAASPLMAVLGMISITGFYLSKTTVAKFFAIVLSTFFICNFLLFHALETRPFLTEYFFSDRFVIGSLLSYALLSFLTILKNKEFTFLKWK